LPAERAVALRHPLYLDVPMMMSYLAYLTDGVASSIDQKMNASYKAEKGQGVEGGIEIPFGGLANVNFKGRYSNTGASEVADEQRITRQHTSASLFNVLLDYLTDHNMISAIDGNDLSEVPSGTFVRASGTFVGNPLEAILDLASQFLPYFEPADSAVAEEPSRKSGNPSKRAAAQRPKSDEERRALEAQREEEESQALGARLISQLRTDLRNNPVADILLESDNKVSVVATLAREFFTDQISAQLRSTAATIVGKVTLVGGDQPLNLLRRTVLVMADDETRISMFEAFEEIPALHGSTDKLVVNPPFVQVMPLAIYI
jgi:hypothetical protein